MLSKLTETQVRLYALAEHIESLDPAKFSMDMWRYNPDQDSPTTNDYLTRALMKDVMEERLGCGTIGCIAGHAVALYRDDINARLEDELGAGHWITWEKAGSMALGDLKPSIARELFVPEYNVVADRAAVSPKLAAAVLRNLAETGLVEWERISAETGERIAPEWNDDDYYPE